MRGQTKAESMKNNFSNFRDMKQCSSCGEFILDEFEICFECQQSDEERERLYKYSELTDFQKAYKDFLKESFWRRFNQEDNGFSFPYTHSTWSEKRINDEAENYKWRIKRGKVKIYYQSVILKVLKYLKEEADDDKSFLGLYDKSKKIKRINKYYRFVAYHQALKNLNIEYDYKD